MYRHSRSLFTLLFVVLFFTAASRAQPAAFSNEKEVKILRGVVTENYKCGYAKEMIYTAEDVQKLLDNKYNDCHDPGDLKVDFEKESLIGYEVNGDCHVRAIAGVTRNDKAKTYTVKVKVISGGCRAVGNYFGWLVIDKIPPGYTVSYVKVPAQKYDTKLDEEERAFLRSLNSPYFQKLETRDIDIKGCIQLIHQHKLAILSNDDFLYAVRKDAGGERCLKDVEKIDFSKHILLGIDINSGYCGIPIGLKYEAFRDDLKQQYVLSISYFEPQETCRAVSTYNLWVLLPKIPQGYAVEFEEKTLGGKKD